MPKLELRYIEFEGILNKYLNLEEFNSLSCLTINSKRIAIITLLNYLGDNDIKNMRDCEQKIVTNHLIDLSHLASTTISGRAFVFRHFFNYLYENEIITYSGNELLPVIFTNKRDKIISFYSIEEVKKIISKIDRSTKSGKRDLAMILLVSELGIRSGDVCRLKLSEIHWERNTIEFIQHKTKVFNQLPLLENLKYALIDYIKNARPECNIPEVFVGIKNGLSSYSNSTILYQFVSQYFIKANIEISMRKHGPHAMRHSLAATLLSQNTPMHVIKEVLGHTNLNTTKAYLKIDLNILKDFALEVPYETM